MFLKSIGYRSEVEASFSSVAAEGLAPGRVVRAQGTRARVLGEDGRERTLLVPRRLVTETFWPVAGDWVAYDEAREVVEHVLPRTSVFERRRVGKAEATQVVAANVDLAVIVMGLDADFSLRRLSRYLTLAHGHHVAATVLLTKAGIAEHVPERLEEARRACGRVPVHAVDVLAGIGLEAIRGLVGPGRTLAFIGSSGVGKSTLVNHLLGHDAIRVNEVRASDGTGRHTTTRRELHVLEGGGVLLDTPGMREVALVGDEEGIDATFEDVARHAEACRFRDCRHEGEPGCAVARAIAQGELDPERVEEAAQLRDELSRTNRRAHDKARGRRMAVALREVMKAKGRA
jgi:ribosome biogenesis GTPase